MADCRKDHSKIMAKDKFDTELLQARWVLGGLRPEELPDQATLALEEGFDGNAIKQLAGLVRPSLRDLETLPDKAFGEMGLRAIDKAQAASVIMARGLPRTSSPISALLKSSPGFVERWKRHILNWGGEPAGPYNDIEQFVHFVVDDLYEAGKRAEMRQFFDVLEKVLAEADDETKNLIALGFFERLQNFASRKPYGSKVFEEFLGPKSSQTWQSLQAIWAGNSR
jgi:hypothetical protein